MKKENDSLRTDLNLVRDRTKILEETIIQIQQSEEKRTKKEKAEEKLSLVRDLFIIPKMYLEREINKRKLRSRVYDILYIKDIQSLATEHAYLYKILLAAAAMFQININDFFHYLKEKRNSNAIFHLDNDLKAFAYNNRGNYDLDAFVASEGLHELDSETKVKLQPVFTVVCLIINKTYVIIEIYSFCFQYLF